MKRQNMRKQRANCAGPRVLTTINLTVEMRNEMMNCLDQLPEMGMSDFIRQAIRHEIDRLKRSKVVK